jgi:hypothetical protein
MGLDTESSWTMLRVLILQLPVNSPSRVLAQVAAPLSSPRLQLQVRSNNNNTDRIYKTDFA